MEASFEEKVRAIFNEAETIEITEGESPEGEYKHVRIRDFNEDRVDEKRARLLAQGIESTVNDYSLGFEVEGWR